MCIHVIKKSKGQPGKWGGGGGEACGLTSNIIAQSLIVFFLYCARCLEKVLDIVSGVQIWASKMRFTLYNYYRNFPSADI
jgi:hypothetical protein